MAWAQKCCNSVDEEAQLDKDALDRAAATAASSNPQPAAPGSPAGVSGSQQARHRAIAEMTGGR